MSDQVTTKKAMHEINNQSNSAYFNIPFDIRILILGYIKQNKKLITYGVCKRWNQDLENDPNFFTTFTIRNIRDLMNSSRSIVKRNIKNLSVEFGHGLCRKEDVLFAGQLITMFMGDIMHRIRFTVQVFTAYHTPSNRFFNSTIGKQVKELKIHLSSRQSCEYVVDLLKECPHLINTEFHLYGLPDGYNCYKLGESTPMSKMLQSIQDKLTNVITLNTDMSLRFPVDSECTTKKYCLFFFNLVCSYKRTSRSQCTRKGKV